MVCATSGFGVGIHNEKCSMVCHAGKPLALDEYYQQIGRVRVRDREVSLSLFSHSSSDNRDHAIILKPSNKVNGQIGFEKSRVMKDFCSTPECRWLFLQMPFGEFPSRCGNCGKCSDSMFQQCSFLVPVLRDVTARLYVEFRPHGKPLERFVQEMMVYFEARVTAIWIFWCLVRIGVLEEERSCKGDVATAASYILVFARAR